MLVELISVGQSSAAHVAMELGQEAVLGGIVGMIGGRLVVLALNKVALPQGLHAPFVTTAALVISARRKSLRLGISLGLSRRHYHRQPADSRA